MTYFRTDNFLMALEESSSCWFIIWPHMDANSSMLYDDLIVVMITVTENTVILIFYRNHKKNITIVYRCPVSAGCFIEIVKYLNPVCLKSGMVKASFHWRLNNLITFFSLLKHIDIVIRWMKCCSSKKQESCASFPQLLDMMNTWQFKWLQWWRTQGGLSAPL